ncbi:hypothetical protein Pint_19400 [Pistacia integerrima]|uniref:Uncharacterized protein n=1 Tax=Pistacia integerrima TaxID=434235 RepID=A0ACC0Z065_9ROSI|nr:hypothetical protein Pint_19400 [Pistacia integerrima]
MASNVTLLRVKSMFTVQNPIHGGGFKISLTTNFCMEIRKGAASVEEFRIVPCPRAEAEHIHLENVKGRLCICEEIYLSYVEIHGRNCIG